MVGSGPGGSTIGHYLRHGLESMSFQVDGQDWNRYMARIPKCDNCGVLHTAQNPVTEQRNDTIYLTSSGNCGDPGYLSISVTPSAHGKDGHDQHRTRDTCKNCLDEIVRSRFAELCGMLAPYQPSRVAGFAQSAIPANNGEDRPITKAERNALRLLSQRLLKA